MNQIAVACHSGSRGKRLPPTSRRMSRQRSARSGNVSVASAIVASMSQRLARRRCPTSSCASTPCSAQARSPSVTTSPTTHAQRDAGPLGVGGGLDGEGNERSEEHTSELQSRLHLVCRLLLEKKKKTIAKLR